MNNLQRKAVWRRRYATPGYDRTKSVTMWVLPHGCMCTLQQVGGQPILDNGTYSAANTLLANLLNEAGITGSVIVYSTEVIPQNTSRWLTWWMSTNPTLDDPLLRTITVTSFGQVPKKILPFHVNVIEPLNLRACDVLDTIRTQSRNPAVSIFILEEDGVKYRMEPERRMDAKVIDCTKYGYVLRTPSNHVFLSSMVSRRVQGQLAQHGLRPEDLIGATVKVEYTMFTDGNRLCNYKSPIVYRCVSLDNMSDGIVPPYHGPYLFISNTPEEKALLTATRCGRAKINVFDGALVGRDDETDLNLFAFRKGAEEGLYSATLERDGKTEEWRFDSDFAIDALDPEAFIRCVDSNLFYATGYNVVKIGLRYVDHTQSPIS
ncbi:hypothetical protein BIZ83_gp007 [Erwinia phage vB_EamM_ChrisDB]|uniref:hypothetical protein n=1 Tax=Erwinia phage vB_EamM_ChrisDB TaxID=1883371 RepID=UPI00081CEBAD|nr:hypothetical protein BIZ83_gp007 [Erwinia phage vB_EamM_ChrisDB]ANZ48846.1 hypothetical protein CHRISDB_284 [Erwinia phage vB_EamM_ChrisDB]